MNVGPLAGQGQSTVVDSETMQWCRVLAQLSARSLHSSDNPLGNLPTAVSELIGTLDRRDASCGRRSRRVAAVSVAIARHLGWDTQNVKQVELAALLHDIGKIGIPDAILLKPASLTPEESSVMRRGCEVVVDVLQACGFHEETIRTATDVSRLSSPGEARDPDSGQGSPVTRLLLVVKAYELLAVDEQFQAGMPHSDILSFLRRRTSTDLDAEMVDALENWAATAGNELSRILAARDLDELLILPLSPVDMQVSAQLRALFDQLMLFEAGKAALHVVGSEMQHVVWNSSAESLFGIPARSLIGKTWHPDQIVLMDPSGSRRMMETDSPLYLAISQEQPVSMNTLARHADGQTISLHLQSIPVFSAQRQVLGLVQIMTSGPLINPSAVEQIAPETPSDQDSPGQIPAKQTPQTPPAHEIQQLSVGQHRVMLERSKIGDRENLEQQITVAVQALQESSDQQPTTLIMLELDWITSLISSDGAEAAERVMLHVTELVDAETYSGETIVRDGDLRLVMLCPETDVEAAIRRADRLRMVLNAFPPEHFPDFLMHASFGIAEIVAADDLDSIFARSEAALQRALEMGGNTVAVDESSGSAEKNIPLEDEYRVRKENEFRDKFDAFVASEIIVHKLRGFVQATSAKILDVDESHVRLRLGKSSWLPFTRSNAAQKPVEIDIQLEKLPRIPSSPTSRCRLHVTIKPRESGSAGEFQSHAKRIFGDLKSHCAGQ